MKRIFILENLGKINSPERVFSFFDESKNLLKEVTILNHNPKVISSLADEIAEAEYEVILPSMNFSQPNKKVLDFIEVQKLKEFVQIKKNLIKLQK